MGCGASSGSSEEVAGIDVASGGRQEGDSTQEAGATGAGADSTQEAGATGAGADSTQEADNNEGTSEDTNKGTSDKIAVTNKANTAKRSPRDYLFKTLIVGDIGVGKSSLLLQFVDGTFTEQHISTRGMAFKEQTVKLDGDTAELQLWDTLGEEAFTVFNVHFYRDAQAIMVVYDITNRESFNSVKQWVNDIERYTRGRVAYVLVGNKSDLTTDRVIEYTTAKEYTDDLDIPFMETSAKDYINVDQAFIMLAAAAKNKEDSRIEEQNRRNDFI